jgi:isopentenyl diphosphate isomerase/L-lactate dehydrogenase-like FMN-dependent dehydrogenase
VLAPAGSNRAFHPDAGIAVAKAAKAGNHLQMATTSIEDAIAARGAPVWFQLYTTQRWGIDLGGISSTIVTNLSWDLIKRLRDTVKVKLVLKGILAFEDAKLAADAGIDAIVVSNHGGRVEDGVSATIDVLPEIVRAVGGRMPVLVDSGFRRGSDIVKALALGAQAVRLYRPALSVGARRFRSARRRARACNPARRDPQRHGAARRAVAQGSRACDGAAGLSFATDRRRKRTACRRRPLPFSPCGRRWP